MKTSSQPKKIDWHEKAEELYDFVAEGKESPIVKIAVIRETLISAHQRGSNEIGGNVVGSYWLCNTRDKSDDGLMRIVVLKEKGNGLP